MSIVLIGTIAGENRLIDDVLESMCRGSKKIVLVFQEDLEFASRIVTTCKQEISFVSINGSFIWEHQPGTVTVFTFHPDPELILSLRDPFLPRNIWVFLVPQSDMNAFSQKLKAKLRYDSAVLLVPSEAGSSVQEVFSVSPSLDPILSPVTLSSLSSFPSLGKRDDLRGLHLVVSVKDVPPFVSIKSDRYVRFLRITKK